MGSTGREEELQQGVVGKRPASPAPHPKLRGRRGGSSAQFGLQPESAGLLTVMVAELWCWVPLVQCSAKNPVVSNRVFFHSLLRDTEPAGHCLQPPVPGRKWDVVRGWVVRRRVYREIRARHRRSLGALQGRDGRLGCWKVLGVAEYVGLQQGGICIFECLVCPFFPFPENSHYRHKVQFWDVAIL